jgi:hypothetical protein
MAAGLMHLVVTWVVVLVLDIILSTVIIISQKPAPDIKN